MLALGMAVASGSVAQQTLNYVPKWNGSTYVNTATPIFEDAANTRIGIGTTTPGQKLDVNGNLNAGGSNTSTTNGYYLGTNRILWHNGLTSCLFAGVSAGASNTGANNTFAGNSAGTTNSTGAGNSAFGYQAMFSNTNAGSQCAFGYRALYANTTGGTFNNAFGYEALTDNTTGDWNAAFGYAALGFNITGSGNSAFGYQSLATGTATSGNSAFGWNALATTTASESSAFGSLSMLSTTTGAANAAMGYRSMYENLTGENCTAMGHQALQENVDGNNNTALGKNAGNTNVSGDNNTFLGYQADASGDYTNATALGNGTVVNATNKVRLGNTAVTVVEGQVFYTTSDARFKTNITESVKGLEFIKKLRPVSYQYDAKKHAEFLAQNMSEETRSLHLNADFGPASAIVHSGFIAQEVEQAAKESNFVTDIVHTPENKDDNYSVSYQAIVVPLVKAVQEQQEMIEKLQAQLNELKSLPAVQNNADVTTVTVELSDQIIVLNDAVPNPFAEQTMIGYTIPENTGVAQLLFYNSAGRIIKSVDIKTKGKGQLSVFANDLTNGIYSYSLIVDGKLIDTKKLVKTD
jgi:hypothetical protein